MRNPETLKALRKEAQALQEKIEAELDAHDQAVKENWSAFEVATYNQLIAGCGLVTSGLFAFWHHAKGSPGFTLPPQTIVPLTCTRCDHSWTPRNPGLPVACPKCRSPYWNKPRETVGQNT